MATHKMQTPQATTIAVAGNNQESKEMTMNTTTTASVRGFGWIGRASAGVAAVALLGAVSLGLVNGLPWQDAAVAVEPARVVAAAPIISDRFRVLKLEQAEQRAAAGMLDASSKARAIPQQYVDLKARHLALRLDQGAVSFASTPAPSSNARQRFAAIKDMEAAQRADTATVLGSSLSPERYRELKERQIEERLDLPLVTVAPAARPLVEQYRQMKEQQVEQRLAHAGTGAAPGAVHEHYRQLKELQVEAMLDAGTLIQPRFREQYRQLKERQAAARSGT